ncbi:MAG: carboxylesterase family protein [Aliidongia sp.]
MCSNGIRYAASPEGALRWAPPQAPVPPPGVVVASAPGNACPQGSGTQSEDCLFLNVYIPASAAPNSRLPVFYWIHGGSLTSGTGAEYDASEMVAEHNIIVVTINYRLGALGWLVEPGLTATAASTFEAVGDAGNYGLMDQQFGMQWVQANIAGFGGDVGKVTIGGESAGGLSVSSDLASTNTAQGLFRGAIIESGGYMLHDVPSQQAYLATYGAAFDTALGCTQPADADCLRSQSVAQILKAQGVFGANGISPDFGTRILPQGLQTAFSSGAFNHVPVLQGSNANEGRLFEPDYIPLAASAATRRCPPAARPIMTWPMPTPTAPRRRAPARRSPVPTRRRSTCSSANWAPRPRPNTPAVGAALAAVYALSNFPDSLSRRQCAECGRGAGPDLHGRGLCLQRLRLECRSGTLGAGLRL